MGLRFYRRVHIAPGLRLNVGTRGISASFGHRGAWYTVGAHGRRTATLGFPGTGLRYTTTSGGSSRPKPLPATSKPSSAFTGLVCLAVLVYVVFKIAFAIGSVMAQ